MLTIDLNRSILQILELTYLFVDIQEHSSLNYPYRLSQKGCKNTGFNASPSNCIHRLHASLLKLFLPSLITKLNEFYFQKKKDIDEAWHNNDM